MTLKICIDSREPSSIKDYLQKQFKDINFEIKTLIEGDFESKSVIVERKRIDDLWSSLHDGRFRSQVSRLATHQCNKIIIFLITDSIDEFIYKMRKLKLKVSEDALDGAIASLIVRDNFRVIVNSNEKRGLKQMIRTIQKIEEEGVLNYPASRDCDMLFTRILNIPKDSWFEIKDKYGCSISYLSSLTEKDFTKVRGISKIRAKRIVEILKNGW